MGGADVIRQALGRGLVDELTISIAPVVLGAGKRLFDGFRQSVELDILGTLQSPSRPTSGTAFGAECPARPRATSARPPPRAHRARRSTRG